MKDGSDSLPKASPVRKRSGPLPLFTAHRMARGMPIRRPITSAMTMSSIDTGRRSVTAASTVSPVRKERPRSPCSTLHSQCP